MRLICSKYLQVLDSLLRSSQAAGETQGFWTIFQNFSARGPTHQGKKPRSGKTDSKFKIQNSNMKYAGTGYSGGLTGVDFQFEFACRLV